MILFIPTRSREKRPDVLLNHMANVGLATLVTFTPGGFEASHLPSVTHQKGDGVLRVEMHVARPNKLIRSAESGGSALAIFAGPNAYIHPGWYPSKAVDHRAVPTWTYMAVHAQGTLSCFTGNDLLRHLSDLTAKHESGRADPWSLSDAPEDYIAKLTKAIVGIRLEVTKVEGSWKLQQHHVESNRIGLIEGLQSEGREDTSQVASAIAATLAG